jgi:hypothetical protein
VRSHASAPDRDYVAVTAGADDAVVAATAAALDAAAAGADGFYELDDAVRAAVRDATGTVEGTTPDRPDLPWLQDALDAVSYRLRVGERTTDFEPSRPDELDAGMGVPCTSRFPRYEEPRTAEGGGGMPEYPEVVGDRRTRMSAGGKAQAEVFDRGARIAGDVVALRLAHGWTQSELADLSGVDQGDISRVERGLSNATQATLGRLAAALNAELRIVPLGVRPGTGEPAGDVQAVATTS